MVRISLSDVGDSVRLVIEDDGVGFEPLAVDESSHFGLQLMRERVELAGGTFHLEASVDRGTRVTVVVPVERPTL
jgi:two-component system sensor histidine kinase DegS